MKHEFIFRSQALNSDLMIEIEILGQTDWHVLSIWNHEATTHVRLESLPGGEQQGISELASEYAEKLGPADEFDPHDYFETWRDEK